MSASADPFAKWRPKTASQQEPRPQESLESEDRFAQWRPKQPQKESTLANVGRQIGRTGARVAETAIGAPRAFGEFLESIVPEKALVAGAEKIGLGKGAKALLETTKKIAPYKLFPKSEDIRQNVTKNIFGEKLEPKNEWESKADELVSDFTALALPLPGKEIKLLKPALMAIGGNVASDIVGRMGGSEKQKTYTKLGTFLAGSLFNPKGAEKLRNQLYEQAREARPSDATVATKHLESSLDKLEDYLRKGGIAGSDKPALEKIADIRAEMQGALVPVESLERVKVKINEARAGLYKALEGNRPGIKSAKRNLDSVSKSVDDALKLYGKQNPEWEAFYRPANEVHGAIAQSKRVRNWLMQKKAALGTIGALSLFGIEQAIGLPKTVAGLAAGAGILETGELAARIVKSPTLAKHYSRVVTSALRDDMIAARENLKKLDKELKKAPD